MTPYDLPDVVQVEADGPIRVIRLNRPDQLNATNRELHAALAALWPQLDADLGARAAVLTGNGRAFSAGGDFDYISDLADDIELRAETLVHGRQIVTGMVRCRVPVVAAVNGPAVGLGCSLVALSDVVYMAESAHLADPHVLLGLVAADGGPVTWPLLTSLQLAKEYALTGDRIPAKRAAEIGLANHVVPDDTVLDEALACARKIAALPQRATEDTKRILNIHLERAVLAALDFAFAAEDRSFTSPELRANVDRLRGKTAPDRRTMDFDLSDDQLELQRVVRDVAERERPPTLVREVVEKGEDPAGLWATYVQLDWPSLTIPEVDGGMGYTAVELAIVLDELGRVADPSPFLGTVSQYAPLVREAFAAEHRRELLGAVCAGGTGAAAYATDAVGAEPDAGGWMLHGTARYVVDGDRADQLAVVATTPDGPGVFVVPAADVTATRGTTFDGSFHVADVAFDGVAVPADRAATGPAAAIAATRAHDEALVGIASATVGASQRTFEIALGHIKDRNQFGVPIGSFQALKHMAVDVYIAIEKARALCQYAGLVIAEDDARRSVVASMAKAAAGDAQRIAVKHGIQFFGGLGYTWENDVQLYARRAKVGELLFGGTHEHRAIVARATLDEVTR